MATVNPPSPRARHDAPRRAGSGGKPTLEEVRWPNLHCAREVVRNRMRSLLSSAGGVEDYLQAAVQAVGELPSQGRCLTPDCQPSVIRALR
jgi:hypothetical protein